MHQECTDEELAIGAAIKYMASMYFRITKKKPLIIYKNEQVHYLLFEMWCLNKGSYEQKDVNNLILLARLAKKMTYRYPEVECEIIENLLDHLVVVSKNQELAWYHGYFSSLLEQSGTSFVLEDIEPSQDIELTALQNTIFSLDELIKHIDEIPDGEMEVIFTSEKEKDDDED